MTSLKTIRLAVSRDNAPLLRSVRWRTVEKKRFGWRRLLASALINGKQAFDSILEMGAARRLREGWAKESRRASKGS
jgi:hypothetical protein